jgi:hypothetical protein
MLDFGHLPKPLTGTVDYFPGFSDTNGGAWEVWNKPRGCMFIRILTIAGGGGGGRGGAANGAANSAGGGGGGASSGMSTLTIPAVFVPDRLYVSSGLGGAGGSAGAGSAGISSIVSIAPANVNIYILCYANAGTGGGAGSNTSTTVGNGGSGGGQAVITTANQGFQGHLNAIAGQNGAFGSSITYPTTGILLSGGAGGGTINTNVSSSAGSVNAPASQSSVYTLFQTLTAVSFSDGQAGVELYQPLMSCGGVGGASAITGGRRGGAGGFGSGGGGGGAATGTGASGGAGGNGGAGLVVIQTW